MRKFITLFAIAALSLTACDSMISLNPESQLRPEDYFRTAEDLQLFSNTFYNNLLEKAPWSVDSDVFIKANPSNFIKGGEDRYVPATGGGWSWGDLRKMNTLLGNMDKCEDKAAVKEYTALTKFWRAYFYFDKVVRFGDVPWIDRELNHDDEALYNGRDSRETIMQHMIEDIDEAIANLPGKADAPETAYRVNKYTAMFLKAQFCLFEGTFRKYHSAPAPFSTSYTAEDGSTHDWQWYLEESEKASKALIDSKQYKIFKTGNPKSDYATLFNSDNANTDEIILAVNFDLGLKIKHDCGREFTNQAASRPGMTKKMVDMYLMNDGTRFTDIAGWETKEFADEVAYRDPRLSQTIRTPGYKWSSDNCGPEFGYCMTGYQITKYVQSYDKMPYSTDNSYNDMPVYRYAEALLNYAEAKAELGTLTQMDLDKTVNEIRKRVAMPGLDMAEANAHPDPYLMDPKTGYTNVDGANKGVILEIRRERAVELFAEGFGRYIDLMRWKAGYCIKQGMYGMYFKGAGKYDFGDKSKYELTADGKNGSDTKFPIYDPATPDKKPNGVIYLRDVTTEEFATSGVLDPMVSIGHSFDEEKHYFFPIPSNELLLNTNLDQNPNW